MFSEDPDALSNPNFSMMDLILSLMLFRFVIILGIIITTIGVIIMMFNLKNKFDKK